MTAVWYYCAYRHYNSDPIRNQKGPGRAVSSQHAQQGSHGLSGQAPK